MQWMDGFGMTELIDIGCVPSTAESDKHEKNKALLAPAWAATASSIRHKP